MGCGVPGACTVPSTQSPMWLRADYCSPASLPPPSDPDMGWGGGGLLSAPQSVRDK